MREDRRNLLLDVMSATQKQRTWLSLAQRVAIQRSEEQLINCASDPDEDGPLCRLCATNPVAEWSYTGICTQCQQHHKPLVHQLLGRTKRRYRTRKKVAGKTD